MLGIYLHVPFCIRKCPYCAFYSVGCSNELIDGYVKAAIQKIRSYKNLGAEADTVYFGGGTPSCLSGEAVGLIMEEIKSSFRLADGAEITLEANPSSLTKKRLCGYIEAGVNRLSIGVQSAVDGELSLLGRLHSWSEAKNAVLLAREQGVDNISCDLILGTPGQTLESLALSVSRLLELKVPHISAYMLKIEENTPFDCDGIKDLAAGEDLVCDMYLSLCRTLRDSGYSRYEISNFSLPGYFSRHNLKYWTLKEYLGIGPSAHSFIGGRRLYIPSDVAGFINNLVSEDLVEDDNINMLEEYIMLSLRLDSGASYQKIASLGGDAGRVRHKAEIFSQNGLIKLSDSSFSLTDRGALVSNSLILEIYLAAIGEDV